MHSGRFIIITCTTCKTRIGKKCGAVSLFHQSFITSMSSNFIVFRRTNSQADTKRIVKPILRIRYSLTTLSRTQASNRVARKCPRFSGRKNIIVLPCQHSASSLKSDSTRRFSQSRWRPAWSHQSALSKLCVKVVIQLAKTSLSVHQVHHRRYMFRRYYNKLITDKAINTLPTDTYVATCAKRGMAKNLNDASKYVPTLICHRLWLRNRKEI